MQMMAVYSWRDAMAVEFDFQFRLLALQQLTTHGTRLSAARSTKRTVSWSQGQSAASNHFAGFLS
jgi:hypothetical protein